MIFLKKNTKQLEVLLMSVQELVPLTIHLSIPEAQFMRPVPVIPHIKKSRRVRKKRSMRSPERSDLPSLWPFEDYQTSIQQQVKNDILENNARQFEVLLMSVQELVPPTIHLSIPEAQFMRPVPVTPHIKKEQKKRSMGSPESSRPTRVTRRSAQNSLETSVDMNDYSQEEKKSMQARPKRACSRKKKSFVKPKRGTRASSRAQATSFVVNVMAKIPEISDTEEGERSPPSEPEPKKRTGKLKYPRSVPVTSEPNAVYDVLQETAETSKGKSAENEQGSPTTPEPMEGGNEDRSFREDASSMSCERARHEEEKRKQEKHRQIQGAEKLKRIQESNERLRKLEEEHKKEREKLRKICPSNAMNKSLHHILASNRTYTPYPNATHESPQTYDMTPPKKVAASTEENYNIDDLGSGDNTDYDDAPRKVVPRWARDGNLRSCLSRQYYTHPDVAWVFRDALNGNGIRSDKIFKFAKSRYFKRKSSEQWNSPIKPVGHISFTDQCRGFDVLTNCTIGASDKTNEGE